MTDRDLEQLSGFLCEILGQWYQHKPSGDPPSVDPANILVNARPVAEPETATAGLLDSDDTLDIAPGTDPTEDEDGGSDGDDENGRDSDDTHAEHDDGDTHAEHDDGDIHAEHDDGDIHDEHDDGDIHDEHDDGDIHDEYDGGDIHDERDRGNTHDERDGVFAASATVAQVAVGRLRAGDESWDDVVQLLEADRRPALASALWVGLAAEPGLRYRSIGQWRRSVDAALRSDAATATMLDEDDERHRTVPIVVAAAIVLAVLGGAFVLLRNDTTAGEDAGLPTTESSRPAPTGNDETSSTGETTAPTGGRFPTDQVEGVGDPCAVAGPLGPITIDQVSDTAIVVSWSPTTEAVDILLDGAFLDTVPPEAFRYVIEHRPLSDEPLLPDTEYLVGVEPGPGEASTACTTTLSSPVPGSEVLIGVTAPTGFEVIETTATSITVGWDPRAGADLHNLFLNGDYIQFGDVGGSTAIGNETEFTFLDLEPDTTYEIGIRRIEGPNQSSLVTITASTDPE